MFWNKKKDPIGHVLKFFKIIKSEDLNLYNSTLIKKIIDLIIFHLYNNDSEIFHSIEKNYSSKSWKSINSFFNNIENSNSKEIVYLSVFGDENNIIIYENNLLNQEKPEEFGLIEFNICSKLNFNEENIKLFVNNLVKIFQLDYGYFFYLEKNMDLISERKSKTSIFGTSSSVTKEDIENSKKLLNIKNGYFPKLYPLNILNNCQYEKLNFQKLNSKDIFQIDDNLKILTIK